MKKQSAIPTVISSLRIAALPLFIHLFNLGNIWACLFLLAFCATTDYFDGYFARKLNATSKFGAYYDATTDFVLTGGIFAFFTFEGFYPIWLVILIAISFVQFVITSVYAKKLYDPVGKYIGSALYIGIALTLFFQIQPIFDFVQYAFLVFIILSLASRIWSLAKKAP